MFVRPAPRKFAIFLLFVIFVRVTDAGQRFVGELCTDHAYCNHGSEGLRESRCSDILDDEIDGYCECVDGFYGDNGDTVCVRSKIDRVCKERNNPYEYCATGTVNSYCDLVNNVCSCDEGYHQVTSPTGQVYCSIIEVGTPCKNDQFCQAYITDSHCDVGSKVCTCLGDSQYVAGNSTCVRPIVPPPLPPGLSDDTGKYPCTVCVSTGGLCWDSNADGEGDSCYCKPPKASSDHPMITGCDIHYVGVCEPCGADTERVCVEEYTVCRYDKHMAGYSSTCQCIQGYVQVPDSLGTGYHCHKIIYDDVNCETCHQNGGLCYDRDGDGLRNGCQCPLVASSSNEQEPTTDCDTKHVNVECGNTAMRISYYPHGGDKYTDLMCKLDAGEAVIKLQKQASNPHCQFRKDGDEWSLTVPLNDGGRMCGTEKSRRNNGRKLVFTNTFSVLLNEEFKSAYDLCFSVFCEYDSKVHISSGGATVNERKRHGSEGQILRPDVRLQVESMLGDEADEVKLGTPVRLHIMLLDSVYNAMRPELCLVATQPVLDIPGTEILPLYEMGCPLQPQIKDEIQFLPHNNSLRNLKSTPFPMMRLPSSDFLYFHCIVRVCLKGREENCHPIPCNLQRERRSLSNVTLTSVQRRLRHNDDVIPLTTSAVRVLDHDEDRRKSRWKPPKTPGEGPDHVASRLRPSEDVIYYPVIILSCLASIIVTPLVLAIAPVLLWSRNRNFPLRCLNSEN